MKTTDVDTSRGAVEQMISREPLLTSMPPQETHVAKMLRALLARAEKAEAELSEARAEGRREGLGEALSHKWLCFHKCNNEEEVVSVSDILALLDAKASAPPKPDAVREIVARAIAEQDPHYEEIGLLAVHWRMADAALRALAKGDSHE